MIDEIQSYLETLRGKTIIAKTPQAGVWTPPIEVRSIGKKRVHIYIYGVASMYLIPKAFLRLIIDGIEIIDEPQLARYTLTEGEQSLLDL